MHNRYKSEMHRFYSELVYESSGQKQWEFMPAVDLLSNDCLIITLNQSGQEI